MTKCSSKLCLYGNHFKSWSSKGQNIEWNVNKGNTAIIVNDVLFQDCLSNSPSNSPFSPHFHLSQAPLSPNKEKALGTKLSFPLSPPISPSFCFKDRISQYQSWTGA